MPRTPNASPITACSGTWPNLSRRRSGRKLAPRGQLLAKAAIATLESTAFTVASAQCVAHRFGGQYGHLGIGHGNHAIAPIHQSHRGRRRHDLEPPVPLGYLENLTRRQAKGLPERLGNDNAAGRVNGRSVPQSTRDEHIAANLETWRVLNGDVLPFDEAAARRFVEASHDRASDPAAATNHDLAARQMTADRLVSLSSVKAPTLVVHGSEDPLRPLAHGQALAAEIPTRACGRSPAWDTGSSPPDYPVRSPRSSASTRRHPDHLHERDKSRAPGSPAARRRARADARRAGRGRRAREALRGAAR